MASEEKYNLRKDKKKHMLLYLSVLVGPVVGTAAHGGGAGSGADTGTGKDGSVHCDGDVCGVVN